jgi:hypothetical protein
LRIQQTSKVGEILSCLKEYTSPKDVALPALRAGTSFSPSVPVIAGRAPILAFTRTSRRNSRVSQASNVSDKITVLRDDDEDATLPKTNRTTTSRATRDELSRELTKPPSTNPRATAQALLANMEPNKDEIDLNNGLNVLDLAQRLRDIAARRKTLLHQLHHLQQEEDQVQAQFEHSLVSGTPRTRYRMELQGATVRSCVRTWNAPLLPVPIAARIPSQHTSKITQKLVHARTLSAPTHPTPSGPRYSPSNSSKRIPLADKTEETKTEMGNTSPYLGASAFLPAMRDRQAERVAPTTELNIIREGISRIPINFGDESPRPIVGTSTSVRRSRTGSHGNICARDSSTIRSRSRGRGPVTPAMKTPYEVPRTVARKKWDF